MGKWFASVKGQDTGNEYVYEIDGPTGASISEVTNAALAAHGQNVLYGTVNEVVDPVVTVTKIKP